jgi:hypothetical protein
MVDAGSNDCEPPVQIIGQFHGCGRRLRHIMYPIPECIDKDQGHYTGRRTCVVYATTTQDSSFLAFLWGVSNNI